MISHCLAIEFRIRTLAYLVWAVNTDGMTCGEATVVVALIIRQLVCRREENGKQTYEESSSWAESWGRTVLRRGIMMLGRGETVEIGGMVGTCQHLLIVSRSACASSERE